MYEEKKGEKNLGVGEGSEGTVEGGVESGKEVREKEGVVQGGDWGGLGSSH